MNIFDVVIIGGGTAGTMLARELGKFKHKTLILDRKNNLLDFSFNTLASYIKLEDFNLSKNVVAQEIDTLNFHTKNVKRVVKADNLYVLDKKKVHEELIDSFDDTYVTVKTGIHVRNILQDANGFYTAVEDQHKNKYSGKIIIDSTGTNGSFSKKVGLRDKKIELATGVEYNVKYLGNPKEIHLLVGEMYQGGYAWVFPLKNDRAIFGFGTFNATVIKVLKKRLNDALELPKIKKLVVKDNEKVEGGSVPITPVLEKFVLKNLVCVGDSVSQVNPIVAEGYKFIFEAALMASKAIDKSLKNNDLDYLNEYETDWKNRFLANYKRSKSAQQKLFKYSNNDYIMDFALLLSKLRSDKKILRTITGEYGLDNF